MVSLSPMPSITCQPPGMAPPLPSSTKLVMVPSTVPPVPSKIRLQPGIGGEDAVHGFAPSLVGMVELVVRTEGAHVLAHRRTGVHHVTLGSPLRNNP